MPDPTEMERMREEVLAECADIVEVQGNGTRRYLGPRVAPVNAKLDALLAAKEREAYRAGSVAMRDMVKALLLAEMNCAHRLPLLTALPTHCEVPALRASQEGEG